MSGAEAAGPSLAHAGERRPPRDRTEIAVVGGSIAGAAIGSLLADRGHDVIVLERSPEYRWRACGVFSSPAAVRELRGLGLDARTVALVARPVPAMRVEAEDGSSFRLTYGADGADDADAADGACAVGLDRSRLDPELLDLARRRGADVRTGVTVTDLNRENSGTMGWRISTRTAAGEASTIRAAVLVGADGVTSFVARRLGVARKVALEPRIGLTYHQAENAGDSPDAPEQQDPPRDARMVVIPDGYCGVAPVPGGRMNVGIVLTGRYWRDRLRAEGAAAVCREIVASLPARDGDDDRWRLGPLCERTMGADPLGHAVARRASDGWLLVGDAAGFLDPFTGEGIHRALVSARVGAEAVSATLHGRTDALGAYARAMDRRFRSKDVVSWLVQAFLGAPPLFDYAARRLAKRGHARETMGLVMGDLMPASRALDPRFLAELLSP